MNVVDWVTIGVCVGGLLGWGIFGVAYHVKTGGAWRRHEMGWLLMFMPVNLFLMLALILSTRVFGDWPGRRGLVLTLAALWMLQPWWFLRMLWHAPRGQWVERSRDMPPSK